MTRTHATQDKLLTAARALFWRRGYANVGLREIAKMAGVDVALVSRYFGGKRGLFDATLDGAFDFDWIYADPVHDTVEMVARAISAPVTDAPPPDPFRLLIMNAADEDVGPKLRQVFEAQLMARLREELDGPDIPQRAALFMAAVLGVILARKSLKLQGIADMNSDMILTQNRYLLHAALAYPGPEMVILGDGSL